MDFYYRMDGITAFPKHHYAAFHEKMEFQGAIITRLWHARAGHILTVIIQPKMRSC